METVKHPDHYAKGRKFEPYKVIKDWDLNFNLGSAVKYIARAGRKDNAIEDLEKAKQYLEYEIEALKEGRNETSGSSDGGDAPERKIEIRFESSAIPTPPRPTIRGIIVSKDVYKRMREAGLCEEEKE